MVNSIPFALGEELIRDSRNEARSMGVSKISFYLQLSSHGMKFFYSLIRLNVLV